MKIAVLKERYPGERRVALTPANVPQLAKLGIEVLIERGAGVEAGFPDKQYEEKGAVLVEDPAAALQADVLLQVRSAGMDADNGELVRSHLQAGKIVIGSCDPLGKPQAIADWAGTGVSLFSLELIPRITRAQSMDVLSSQATIAGYRAVLEAATELPKLFPMMMTAAGTLTAAKVFVIGAGVAGLQAIATARKLGAIVSAYDVRPACREQVESLGGKFVELEIDATSSEDKGGYAKAMDEEFYRKQRALMADVVAGSDVVITTAAIPGRKSPLLVTAEAVRGMPAGGVIIDLAAERGGNCELSQPDQRVHEHGITILGPTNIAAEIPNHASQMLGNNVVKFLANMVKEGRLEMNLEDEIVRDTLVVHKGEITNDRIRSSLAPASSD
ncbi:Re/Si-specific NAD(P)(+) transhydrogenase subunit alpha [Aureliella helgolandensis]|uniref:NAD(P) transhydrogenase subunit alpha part 1 n=1 Tax=Aureliella helgolandensis TaxID=2527968 RepID=A0A518G8G4_9BACT|nr:Re/Si-specific NAD(P)(+) transhydrogenase subunit alpha [Aureliella helgolandensis]QDV24874.1 NAD(P) transhydrogenase subunit alpha part 1 [Aureliella helgolandensis]